METTGTAVARIQDTGAAVVRKTTGHHGEVRGLNLSRRSSQFEGRFGRMFRTLPAAQFDEQMLRKLADAMSAEAEDAPTPETEADDEENGDRNESRCGPEPPAAENAWRSHARGGARLMPAVMPRSVVL